MAELKLEQKQEPGKLRIYIGAAPGVGKTYMMLNDAHRMMHQQGIDLVIGLVEPHGREETRARIRDLEIIPLRVIPYRGVELQDAVEVGGEAAVAADDGGLALGDGRHRVGSWRTGIGDDAE